MPVDRLNNLKSLSTSVGRPLHTARELKGSEAGLTLPASHSLVCSPDLGLCVQSVGSFRQRCVWFCCACEWPLHATDKDCGGLWQWQYHFNFTRKARLNTKCVIATPLLCPTCIPAQFVQMWLRWFGLSETFCLHLRGLGGLESNWRRGEPLPRKTWKLSYLVNPYLCHWRTFQHFLTCHHEIYASTNP